MKLFHQEFGSNMTVGSSRGPRGGLTTTQMKAKPRTVHLLILRRMSLLGNGVMLLVQLHFSTFVKGVSE